MTPLSAPLSPAAQAGGYVLKFLQDVLRSTSCELVPLLCSKSVDLLSAEYMSERQRIVTARDEVQPPSIAIRGILFLLQGEGSLEALATGHN